MIQGKKTTKKPETYGVAAEVGCYLAYIIFKKKYRITESQNV